MLIATTNEVPNKKTLEYKGLCKGSMIKAKHIGKDIMAGLKNIVGGEIKQYSQMMDEARSTAINRMIKEAEEMGANAIIGFRLTSTQVMQGASEIIAYGTAVVVE